MLRCLSAFLLLWCAGMGHAMARPPVTVAIVQDGPDWYFEALIDAVQKEVADLQEREIRFRWDERYNARWDSARVKEALEAALQDPRVDVVFAAGFLVAQEAGRADRHLAKPVLAGALQDPALTPFQSKANFAFVINPKRIQHDLAAMRELFDVERLYVVIDQALKQFVEAPNVPMDRLSQELEMPFTLIAVRHDVAEALAAIPEEVDVLYVTPLLRMDDKARTAFYDGLARRGIRTFALLGQTDVARGALAGIAPQAQTRLARRLALNLLALTDGRPAMELPTELILPEQLSLNEQTMRQVAYRSSVGTLLQTRLSEEMLREELPKEVLTLEMALEQALQGNIRLTGAEASREVAAQERRMARGALFPQLDAQAAYMQIDRERAAASLGLQARSRTTGGVALSQVIFSDEVFSRLRAAGHGLSRREWEIQETRLAVTQDVALRFFEALSAGALLRVASDQHDRIRDNLELARLRVGVGQTEPEDAMLWESEAARQTAAVLSARAQLLGARAALNQAMGLTPDTPWQLQAVALADAQTYFLDDSLRFATGSYHIIIALTDFWRELAQRESPALQALDAAIAAQEIMAEAGRRVRYLPKVGLRAAYDRVLDRQTEGPDIGAGLAAAGIPLKLTEPSDNEWHIGIAAELPLFDGGLRRAGAARADAELRYLQALREETRQQIDAAVMAAYARVMASQPNIRLSRTRTRLAQESLELIQKRYHRGAAGLVDVLDAQGRAFEAEQAAVVAVNQYLQDLTRFQRAIAWFAWLKPAAEQAELIAQIKAWLEMEE